MQKIALIGSTGSIGKQVLEIVRRYPAEFSVTALVAGSDEAALAAQKAEFRPRIAYCASRGEMPEDLFDDCDTALIAAAGFSGLGYTLAAARAGKKIALANKESLVCGGALVIAAAQDGGAQIVPVDSEHSAIFQALSFDRAASFERLVLTASGGPFFGMEQGSLAAVTAADALNHPTWHMGSKITIDSATLLNKGYEVIEAHWLYNAAFDRIDAVVHPESIVHSLVYFSDGAALAQLGYPDMRVPIQLALTYPRRLPCAPQLDLVKLGALHFYPLPREKFPCFALALSAGRAGGTAPTVLNGAAETAVKAFLEGSITFPQIAETIEDALNKISFTAADCYETLREADLLTRRAATAFIYGK